jgi:hypothetical protein
VLDNGELTLAETYALVRVHKMYDIYRLEKEILNITDKSFLTDICYFITSAASGTCAVVADDLIDLDLRVDCKSHIKPPVVRV